MSSLPATRVPRAAYVAIGALSLSLLVYEVLLTRVIALRMYFHFSFLVISHCMLGLGAAASVVSLLQARLLRAPLRVVSAASGLYLLALVAGYGLLLSYPLPVELDLRRADHLGQFVLFTSFSVVPFFLGGLALSVLLSAYASGFHRLYSVDLVAAALGCLASPALLWAYGAGGGLVVVALAALLAWAVTLPPRWRRPGHALGVVLGLCGLWLLPRLDAQLPVPSKRDLSFLEQAGLRIGARPEHSRWSSNSRVDLLAVKGPQRFLPFLGRHADTRLLPEQKFLVQDGSAGTMLVNFSDHPQGLSVVERSMYSAALSLSHAPRVLVIGVGGGVDLWAARAAGARSIRGVELNASILEMHREVLPHYSRALLSDPRVRLVHAEGRHALGADPQRYDVIQLSGADTWTALTSGAYMLAENYLYTRESFEQLVGHLAPGGILQLIRVGTVMESLRLLSTLEAALQRLGEAPGVALRQSVAYLRGDGPFFALLYKRGGFRPADTKRLVAFAQRAGLDLSYAPGLPVADPTLLHRFVQSDDRTRYIEAFPYDISAATDDRPYFFNYTRWDAPSSGAPLFLAPPHVSQGNPLLILGQLGISALLSGLLIVGPLLLGRRVGVLRSRHAGRMLVYFGSLGLGFIAIEVALMQKLTLLLGHPVYSLTVTLAALLLSGGLGSLFSSRLAGRLATTQLVLPLLLAAAVLGFAASVPAAVELGIAWPLPLRVLLCVSLVAPLGVLMGTALPYGMSRLKRDNPSLIPWAWGVNACLSVVGAVATVVGSMVFGFAAVMVAAAGIYCIGFATLPR